MTCHKMYYLAIFVVCYITCSDIELTCGKYNGMVVVLSLSILYVGKNKSKLHLGVKAVYT